MIKRIKKYLGILDFEKRIKQCEHTIELFRKIIDVGVDHHMKTDSWAVVCIKGQPEYVNFFVLKSAEVREIQRFLRQFDRRNITIDTPPYMARELFFK